MNLRMHMQSVLVAGERKKKLSFCFLLLNFISVFIYTCRSMLAEVRGQPVEWTLSFYHKGSGH